MIEMIQHMLGICPDHHAHFNLILFLNETFRLNFCWCYIKNKALKLIRYENTNARPNL